MNLPVSGSLSSSGSYCIKKETYSTFYFHAVLYLVPRAELMSQATLVDWWRSWELQTIEVVTQSDSIIPDKTTTKRICQIMELWEIQWSWSDRVGGLLRRGRDWSLILSPCTCTRERPCEDTMRRWLSVSREERPQHQLPVPVPWPQAHGLHNCEKRNFCDILL